MSRSPLTWAASSTDVARWSTAPTPRPSPLRWSAHDKGIGAATAAANDQFEGNSPGSKNGYTLNTIVASPACGGTAGHITVSYTSQQPLYFAPVLGMSDHRDVTTEATASWGPGGPFPIAVNLGPANAFKTCSINATPGTECYYLFDNNQNGNGDFGFLNLAKWGAPSDQDCNGAGGANLIADEITGAVGYSQYVFRSRTLSARSVGSRARTGTRRWRRWWARPARSPSMILRMTTAKRWYIVGFAQMTILSVDQNAKAAAASPSPRRAKPASGSPGSGGGVGIGATQLETVNLCDLRYGTDPVKGTCLG